MRTRGVTKSLKKKKNSKVSRAQKVKLKSPKIKKLSSSNLPKVQKKNNQKKSFKKRTVQENPAPIIDDDIEEPFKDTSTPSTTTKSASLMKHGLFSHIFDDNRLPQISEEYSIRVEAVSEFCGLNLLSATVLNSEKREEFLIIENPKTTKREIDIIALKEYRIVSTHRPLKFPLNISPFQECDNLLIAEEVFPLNN